MGNNQNQNKSNDILITKEEEESEKINTPISSKNNNMIIGIDFGTSGLCFAYGRLNNNNKQVFLGHFEDQGENNKILNEIILDDELERVLAFGNDCIAFLCSKHEFRFHHFKNIKMNLYKKI